VTEQSAPRATAPALDDDPIDIWSAQFQDHHLEVRATLSALLAVPPDDSGSWHTWAHTIMSSSSHEEASASSAQMSAAVTELICPSH
jgi:hypothetical protein